VFLSNPPAIRIGGQQSRSVYQYTLQSIDSAELYEFGPKLEQELRKLPSIIDVSSDLQLASPQVNITLDRPRIAALGLTVDQVQQAMASAYSSAQISTIYAPNNQYPVIMRVAPEYQDRPDALSLLFIKSSAGALVPLSASRSFKPGVGPQQVNHVAQLPAVTLSFNLAPGVALGDATRRSRRRANLLPATIVGALPGHGAGVSGFAHRPRRDSADGDLRHLHRARHPVRELHPSADDSLGPAGRGSRRAGDADDLRRRSQSLRVRRRHHARRPREEERHHDDRLRARGAAHRQGQPRTRFTRPAWSASVRS
jgi:hypothetical protein